MEEAVRPYLGPAPDEDAGAEDGPVPDAGAGLDDRAGSDGDPLPEDGPRVDEGRRVDARSRGRERRREGESEAGDGGLGVLHDHEGDRARHLGGGDDRGGLRGREEVGVGGAREEGDLPGKRLPEPGDAGDLRVPLADDAPLHDGRGLRELHAAPSPPATCSARR